MERRIGGDDDNSRLMGTPRERPVSMYNSAIAPRLLSLVIMMIDLWRLATWRYVTGQQQHNGHPNGASVPLRDGLELHTWARDRP